MSVRASNLVVLDKEVLVLVSNVLEFIRNCVIYVDQSLMLEIDVSLPTYVGFRSTHAIFRRWRVEHMQTVKVVFLHFYCLLNA